MFICLVAAVVAAIFVDSSLAQDSRELDPKARLFPKPRSPVELQMHQGNYLAAESLAVRLVEEAEAHGDSLELAEALDEQVSAHLAMFRREKRIQDIARRAIRIKEQLLGRNTLRTAASIRGLARCLRYAREYDSAQELFDEVYSIRLRQLGPEHLDVAESIDDLGMMKLFTNRPKDARQDFERALTIRMHTLDSEDPLIAQSHHGLAAVASKMRDYIGVMDHGKLCLAIRERALGPMHPELGMPLNLLANAYWRIGDRLKARELSERAVRIFERRLGPEHWYVASILQALGWYQEGVYDFGGAKATYQRQVELRTKSSPGSFAWLASDMNHVGRMELMLGDVATARATHTAALALLQAAKERGEPDSLIWGYKPDGIESSIAETLISLGQCVQETGDYREALALYERAMSIHARVCGTDTLQLASSLTALARGCHAAGQLERAGNLLKRALRLESAAGADSLDIASTLEALARLQWRLGDPASAVRLLETCRSIRARKLGPEDRLVGSALVYQAEALIALGDHTTALSKALEAERIRRSVLTLSMRTLPERLSLSLSNSVESGLNILMSLACAADGDRETIFSCWDGLIRSRALVLDEMANRHLGVWSFADGIDPQLLQRWLSARQRLAQLKVLGVGDMSAETYRKTIEELQRESEEVEAVLMASAPSFLRQTRRQEIGATDVIKTLQAHSTLVSYFRYNEVPPHGGSGPDLRGKYAAFVLRKGSRLDGVAGNAALALVSLGYADEIEALVRDWKAEASSRPAKERSEQHQAEERYRDIADRLRRAVWDPLVAHLGDTRLVLLVPDGALHLVNFAALPLGKSTYMVESELAVQYLSSERDLVRSQVTQMRGRGFLAIGGPDYDERSLFAAFSHKTPEQHAGLASNSSTSRSQGLEHATPGEATSSSQPRATPHPYRGPRSSCSSFQSHEFPTLPGSRREVIELASLWTEALGAREGVELLIDAGATETAFKHDASRHRVVHVATHGFFAADECVSTPDMTRRGIGGLVLARPSPHPALENPLVLCGLAFAGANHRERAGPEEDDGILTADEVAALDLRQVECVVLSACETALGTIKTGEGVIGLRRAFQVAGVGTIIMSVWGVEDQATRRWMREYYDARLQAGENTASAVRHASLRVLTERRARKECTHPFYWGAFIAAGEWE